MTERSVGRWGFVHITQCRGFATNGSNHWILCQPDQVSKTDTMAMPTEQLEYDTSISQLLYETSHRSNVFCFSYNYYKLVVIGIELCERM